MMQNRTSKSVAVPTARKPVETKPTGLRNYKPMFQESELKLRKDHKALYKNLAVLLLTQTNQNRTQIQKTKNS